MSEQALQKLLAAPECRYDFKGSWKMLTKAEEANWWARQELVSDMRRPEETAAIPAAVIDEDSFSDLLLKEKP